MTKLISLKLTRSRETMSGYSADTVFSEVLGRFTVKNIQYRDRTDWRDIFNQRGFKKGMR